MLSRIETAAATIRANTYYGGAAILPIHFSVEHPILGSANNTLFIRCVNPALIEVTAKIKVYGFTTTVHRFKGSNGWGPFEYYNPPLSLGVEYRTTERYLGKPVYVKLVNFGAIPNTTTKWVSFSDDTNARAIRASAVMNDRNVIPGMTGNGNEYMMEVGTLNQSVGIKTYRDWGNYQVKATVYYWKTTD